MKERGANFSVVTKDPVGKILTICDIGPWEEFPTVTNDAERVVRVLINSKILEPGYRLFYYDSEDQLGELLVVNGRFAGFAPVTN